MSKCTRRHAMLTLSTRRRGTSTMMHSVNWPNDTCVGWMIKTMVPVRREVEYLLSMDQARTGFKYDAHGKKWRRRPIGNSPELVVAILFVNYFAFRLLSCFLVYCRVSLFIVVSHCLLCVFRPILVVDCCIYFDFSEPLDREDIQPRCLM